MVPRDAVILGAPAEAFVKSLTTAKESNDPEISCERCTVHFKLSRRRKDVGIKFLCCESIANPCPIHTTVSGESIVHGRCVARVPCRAFYTNKKAGLYRNREPS